MRGAPYNRLAANLLAFHTLMDMTQALQEIQEAGPAISLAALPPSAPMAPQQYERFGHYALNPNRLPPLERYLAFQIAALANCIGEVCVLCSNPYRPPERLRSRPTNPYVPC